MPKEKRVDTPQPTLKYRRVVVTELSRNRRGKHHDLVQEIVKELKIVPAGSALEIPLADAGIELANLRSAIHRAATAENLPIETLADDKNFYVWQKAIRVAESQGKR